METPQSCCGQFAGPHRREIEEHQDRKGQVDTRVEATGMEGCLLPQNVISHSQNDYFVCDKVLNLKAKKFRGQMEGRPDMGNTTVGHGSSMETNKGPQCRPHRT